eukprot:CAMPEP_0204080122 /NCGR_PEP_ID=MMETSP0360-20130528/173494_1 /ASSEMBLY_ACC=CAM_ASM_000342 /TAXON_ID=268821 /ORGANISM="Scrippsiella Hangoei, Strain SHTV-5" /LENGTH=67 /DNA_ID=CAMNT_0051028885 /DNA_START=285 /DNA_END=485 /DNA_ORIENTATION=-
MLADAAWLCAAIEDGLGNFPDGLSGKSQHIERRCLKASFANLVPTTSILPTTVATAIAWARGTQSAA